MSATVQVAGKYSQIAFLITHNLTNLTTHVMNTIFFNGSTLEFVKAFARSTHVNVENGNVYIRILLTNIHSVFCVVHTANFGAIGLATTGSITATNTAYDYHALRLFTRSGANQVTFSRTSSVSQTLQLHGGNNIFTTSVTKIAVIIQVYQFKTGCQNDGAVFFSNQFVLLGVVDSTIRTNNGAYAALASFKFQASFAVNDRNFRNCLGKGNVNGSPIA